jgi:hypothetical protein
MITHYITDINRKIHGYMKDGKIHGWYGSEIGLCVWILHNQLWGKILVDNRLRSRDWWERQKYSSIYLGPIVEIKIDWEPGIYNQDGTPQEPPIPFEKETKLDRFPPEMWFGIIQILLSKPRLT